MDRVKRNAEIVALVKARKMPMRKIAERYRLEVSSIYAIANEHGVYLRTPDALKVRIASELINCGMPLTHVAQRVGFNIQTLRRILEAEGLFIRPPPTPLWTEAQVRVLRRDYGKPGLSVRSIAAKLGRTPNQIMCKAAGLGL
jgi:transposase-like protein